jgi:uridine kinase
MTDRFTVLGQIAAEVRCVLGSGVTLVGIDGVDGAGKTCFADELVACFQELEVIRSSVDGFHNPRAIRYERGQHSPEGFFRDSFDYRLLKESLLDPLRAGGSMRYRTAVFDHRTDQPVESPTLAANPPSILIVDGIFLHRPELAGYWNYSVFLDVNRRESLRRCVRRDGLQGVPDDPSDPIHERYVKGQDIYLRSCDPKARATRVVNNDDLERPYVAA